MPTGSLSMVQTPVGAVEFAYLSVRTEAWADVPSSSAPSGRVKNWFLGDRERYERLLQQFAALSRFPGGGQPRDTV